MKIPKELGQIHTLINFVIDFNEKHERDNFMPLMTLNVSSYDETLKYYYTGKHLLEKPYEKANT